MKRLMINPDNVRSVDPFPPMEVAATSLGVEPVRAPVRTTVEIESAIAAFARAENAGMIVLPGNLVNLHCELVIQTVARHRLPTVYSFGFWVREGGLIGYGNDIVEPYRLAATYVDRILRGAKVEQLPVQQPTKLELVINLKTARALGLVVPPALLVRADEVIE